MAIEFHFENNFELNLQEKYATWLKEAVVNKGFELLELNYIFFDDHQLLELNQTYLNHDTYTDIITFDYSEGKVLAGDIYISTERVKENATIFGEAFEKELRRVMSHGVLHLMGYGDTTAKEQKEMRAEEEKFIKLFHVEQ